MPAGVTLVLGIGNVLLGDEGIGVVAARSLMESGLTGSVDIVDGGTGGFHLLSYFQDYRRLVLIDAAADGKPPGTVSHLRPKYAHDFPRALSAHDIGLKDLVEAAALLGHWPEIDLITVSITDIQPMSLEISPPVRAALPEVDQIVRALVGPFRRRE